VVAIGGITWENVSTVLEAGADACAIVSGILAGDMRTNVEKFMNAMKRQVIDQRQ
jgi:thiamine monophosphate synthase